MDRGGLGRPSTDLRPHLSDLPKSSPPLRHPTLHFLPLRAPQALGLLSYPNSPSLACPVCPMVMKCIAGIADMWMLFHALLVLFPMCYCIWKNYGSYGVASYMEIILCDS